MGLGLQRHLGLGFSLPDRRAVVRLDSVGDDVGALTGGRRGVHAEATDAAAVYRGVCRVGGREGQVLEYCRVKHSQAMKPAGRAPLVIAYSIHRDAHPLPSCFSAR